MWKYCVVRGRGGFVSFESLRGGGESVAASPKKIGHSQGEDR